jgi:hypothetical protein
MNIRNKRNDVSHGVPSIRDKSGDSYSQLSKEVNKPSWWG